MINVCDRRMGKELKEALELKGKDYEERSTKRQELIAVVKKNESANLVKKKALLPEPSHVDDILAIEKINNKIFYIKRGNDKYGYMHLLIRHADDFQRKGVPTAALLRTIIAAYQYNHIAGHQCHGKGRPIYELPSNRNWGVAMTITDFGMFVGANPKNIDCVPKSKQPKPAMTLSYLSMFAAANTDRVPKYKQPTWWKMGLF